MEAKKNEEEQETPSKTILDQPGNTILIQPGTHLKITKGWVNQEGPKEIKKVTTISKNTKIFCPKGKFG